MRGFLDYVGLWTAINMTAWFTLWWTYDKTVTWSEEGICCCRPALVRRR